MSEVGGTGAVPTPRPPERSGAAVPRPRHAADGEPRHAPAPAPRHAEPPRVGPGPWVPPQPGPLPHGAPPLPAQRLPPQAAPRHAGPVPPYAPGPPQAQPPVGPPPAQAAVPYTPPMPRAPRSRVPGWVLPTALCAVIVLAGSAIGGITVAALNSTRDGTGTIAAGTGDRAFLGTLATRPSFAGIPSDTLIELGHGVCDALAEGTSRGELVSQAVSAGFDGRDARLLVDAANSAYCPAE